MAKHCEYVQQIEHLKLSLEEIEKELRTHKTIKCWAYIIHDKDVKEDGTTKEPHIHLYMNFGQSGASFETVASWFNDEPQYVSKVKGRMSDMLLYLTHANAPTKYQYDSNDVKSNFDVGKAIEDSKSKTHFIKEIDKVIFDFTKEITTYAQTLERMDNIKNNIDDLDVLTYWLKASNNAEKLWKHQCSVSTKKKRDMKVVFIYGESGSGKSTYAQLYAEMLCKTKGYRGYARSSANNDILQDYKGEDILILDDFRDTDEMTGESQNLTDVLKLLDPFHMSSSKSRYTNKTFVGKLIIITSAKDPLIWFKDTNEQRWQFFRRISKLLVITRDLVEEYQELNQENGIPFWCGFSHLSGYISKAKLVKSSKNPVPEYIALNQQNVKTEEPEDLSADIFSFVESLKVDNGA